MSLTLEDCSFWIIDQTQASWSREAWLASYEQDDFAASVMDAADDNLILDDRDMLRLLRSHGISTTLQELSQLCQQMADKGLPVLPAMHAGQALAWLGY